MGTTKNCVPSLHAVTDDLSPAPVAFWRHDVDRALEAIEDVRLAVVFDFECLVVVVAAVFALRHDCFSV
jgi:hypothetical protein